MHESSDESRRFWKRFRLAALLVFVALALLTVTALWGTWKETFQSAYWSIIPGKSAMGLPSDLSAIPRLVLIVPDDFRGLIRVSVDSNPNPAADEAQAADPDLLDSERVFTVPASGDLIIGPPVPWGAWHSAVVRTVSGTEFATGPNSQPATPGDGHIYCYDLGAGPTSSHWFLIGDVADRDWAYWNWKNLQPGKLPDR